MKFIFNLMLSTFPENLVDLKEYTFPVWHKLSISYSLGSPVSHWLVLVAMGSADRFIQPIISHFEKVFPLISLANLLN